MRRKLAGEIREWSACCASLYGYEAVEAIGQNANRLLATGPREVLARAEERLLEDGCWEGVLRQRSATGADLLVLARWSVADEGASAENLEILEDLVDLTEYVNALGPDEGAGGRLASVEAELEAAQEEGIRFSRAVSHGLAAPLTSTRWLLEGLRERAGANLPAEETRLIETALKNLEEMTGLIEAQRSHYRIGERSLNVLSATSARRAVDAAMEKLRAEIIRLRAEISVGVLPRVTVEAVALECLFENVIGNALKFQPAGQAPRVRITAADESGRWLFRVEDNGMGIDPRHAERIFEPLQRLNADIPGRGIGLATCRKIIQRTGGRIWTEGAPGGGSVFCFTLPGESASVGGKKQQGPDAKGV